MKVPAAAKTFRLRITLADLSYARDNLCSVATRLSMTNKDWKHFTHNIEELRMNKHLLILPSIMQHKRVIVVKFSRGIPATSFVNVKENFLERKKQLSDNAAALLLYARSSRGEVFRHSQPVSSDLEQKQRFVERFSPFSVI